MSQENVELVRRWIRLTNARDYETVRDEILDPDIECYPDETDAHTVPCQGRGEYITRAVDERESFDVRQIEVDECIDLGEQVVCVATIYGRGKVSQAEVVRGEVWLSRWRDGKCVEYRECGTKDRALEAAGLSE